MAVMLVNLRGVPEDEAEDIRQLLTENDIPFYETPPGNWGISMPGLWVKEEAEKQRATPLLEKYQQERAATARLAYEQKKASGEQTTFFKLVRENPLRVIIYLAFTIAILYFSIKPFLAMG